MKTLKRLLKVLAALVALGAAAIAVLLVLIWVGSRRDVTLPAPTGPFAVGRITDAWSDDAGGATGVAGGKRELVVWIWYPAAGVHRGETAGYLPLHWRQALARQPSSLLGRLLTRNAALVHVHSKAGAAMATSRSSYPVVMLRAGASALTTDYTTLAEDLASHGFVVVGFDAPYRTGIVVFPDGRVVTRLAANNPETLSGPARERLADRLLAAWTSDTAFVVDRLERLNAARGKFQGRLDLGALGVVGHSLGGATALQFCHDDPRCRAGIDIDGAPRGSVVEDGVRQPFLFLLSDHGKADDPQSRRIMADVRSIYDRLPPDRRSLVVVPGANHFSFADHLLVKNPTLIRILRLAGVLRLEARQGLALTAEHVRHFLDAHLETRQASDPGR